MNEWFTHVFDHPVTKPPWYHATERDSPFDDAPYSEWYRQLLSVLENLENIEARYSEAQIEQGLEYMIIYSGYPMWGFREVSVEERWRLAELSVRLYRNLFAKRCSRDDPTKDISEGSPLDMACWMWWDWLRDAFHDGKGIWKAFPGGERFVDACGTILGIAHPRCQAGALHGLGHLKEHYPRETTIVLEEYIAHGANRDPELVALARHMLHGKVL